MTKVTKHPNFRSCFYYYTNKISNIIRNYNKILQNKIYLINSEQLQN